MTARMRRLLSDFEQVKKDFAGHKNIIVTPVGDEPPEKYHVTYFVNGIYLLPDGRIETLGRHEIEITLHADYPRYKPICKILTPIWHPNFRDSQICIGDIWGAGESLSDIIINIGDMIQYKSWNSYSPLSADAAQWAMENKHLFPVGNIDLYIADYASSKEVVEIDLFDDDGAIVADNTPTPTEVTAPVAIEAPVVAPVVAEPKTDQNDFEITAEELAGIEFVPTAQRMQTVAHGGVVKGNKVKAENVKYLPIYTGVDGEESQGLCIGTENFFCVNSKASAGEQKAAKDFIYWLYSSTTGKDYVTNKLGFIAPFDTFEDSEKPTDPLAQEVLSWMSKDGINTIPWNFTLFPSQTFKDDFGAALLQYAQGTKTFDEVKELVVSEWASESSAIE